MNKKLLIFIIIFIVVILVLALAIGGILFLGKSSSSVASPSSPSPSGPLAAPTPVAVPSVVNVPGKPMVRYVRIEKDPKALAGGVKSMQIAEVEVYSNGVNVAQGKPATQGSVVFGADAGRAVDGNTEGNYFKNSVSHTNEDDNQWWQVDLGQNYPVDKVVIYNRTDCCWERLDGAKLILKNADGAIVKTFSIQGVKTAQTFTL